MSLEKDSADVFDLRPSYKVSNADTHAFMRRKFCAKECTKYTPKVRQKISLDNFMEYCPCGGSKNDHVSSLQQPSTDSNWTEADIVKISTNAFGKINFINTDNYQKPARYVRLADDSNVNDVIELLKDYWLLTRNKPELVISVMGSGKAFNVTSSLRKKIFNRGLIPAIEATGGWLTTFGSNIGVAKAVGDAVRDGQCFYEENGQVRRTLQCIGIAPWGSVRDRELMVMSADKISLKDSNNVDYSADSIVRSGKPTSLNPYHTHFLLVDDGHRNKERGVASFRASLEKKISAPETDGGLNIPVVCILIEGGANSIEYLVHSVKCGLPILVCEGSGRAADVVAFAYRRYKLCKLDQKEALNPQEYEIFQRDLRGKIEKTFFPDNRGDYNKIYTLMNELIQICEKTDLIYLYDVDRKENLDTAILLCLLECQRSNKQDARTQLHLALHWNRADVAKAKIFSSDIHWKDEELRGHFLEALIGEKLDFIKLFVDHGFSVKRYLTVAELRKIYTLSVTDSTFLWHLLKYDSNVTPPEDIYLSEIYYLMQRLTRRFGHPDYVSDRFMSGRDFYTFEKPFQELFLWAVLLNRVESAKYFWEQCADPLMVALSGTFVCLCLAQRAESFSTELQQQYLEAKDALELMAKGLIDQAFESNREKAMVLVTVRSVLWGNLDCMELAALANDREFLASNSCQTLVFRKWKNGYEATGCEIVLSTFTLLPIFNLVQFNEETAHYHETNYGKRSLMCDYQHNYTGTNSFVGPVPYSTRKGSTPSIGFAHRYSIVFPPPRKSNLSRVNSASVDGSTCKRKKLRWYQKVYRFYTSPVVKFTSHVFWYVAFLVLHCYVLLFSFRWPYMTIPEMVLHAWTFTYFCELLRSIVTYPATTFLNKFQDWWYYSGFATWNRLELVCIFIAVIVFVFRWFAPLFAIARLFLALNFITYMFRIYKIFMVNSYLGPKVVMIKRMSRDLAMFLLIVGVLMVSYSVASQALLHPHRSYYSGIFFDIFIHGVWELFGELNDEVTKGNVPDCQSPINETIFGFTGECGMRVWPTAILLAVYLFFGNILLVNMLIAIFASVFTDVQSHSEQIWKSLMYFLVSEYDKKPVLPPPFIILEHFFFIFRWCYRCGGKKNYNSVHIPENGTGSFRFLNVFELVCRSEYLEKQKQADQNPTDLLLIQLNENFQKITHLPEFTTRNIHFAMPKAMARSTIAMSSDTVIDVKDGGRDGNGGADDGEMEADHDQGVEDILFH